MDNQSAQPTVAKNRGACIFVPVMLAGLCLLLFFVTIVIPTISTTVKIFLLRIDAATWKDILGFCAVFFIGALNFLLGAFVTIRNPDYRTGFHASDHLASRWFGSMSTIVVILLIAANQQEGISFIGLYSSGKNNNTTALLAGLAVVYVALLVYAFVYRKVLRAKGKEAVAPSLDLSNPLIAEEIKYHDWRERIAYLTILPFIVISEDLVSRGFLVWYLGNKTGTFIPWAIISIIFSIVIHLYQGRKLTVVIAHFIYASSFVGLLLIFRNLLAVIVAHLLWDLLSTIQIWRYIKTLGNSAPAQHFGIWKTFAYLVFSASNIALLGIGAIWLFG